MYLSDSKQPFPVPAVAVESGEATEKSVGNRLGELSVFIAISLKLFKSIRWRVENHKLCSEIS